MTRLPYLCDSVLAQILLHCDEPTRDRTMLASKNMRAMTHEARRQDYEQAAQRPGRWSREPLPTYEDLIERNCAKPNREHIAKALLPGLPNAGGPLAQFYKRASGLAEAKAGGFTHVESIGSSVYEGGFQAGLYHGFGSLTRANGTRYEGSYQAGKRHGHGVDAHPNGNYYEGGYRAGRMDGLGTFVWQAQKRYEGGFQDGQLHGHGVLSWTDGSRHEGNFHRGKYQGHGAHTWPDGLMYVGNYENNLPHGRGIMTYPDGLRYEGDFQNDFREGRGVETDADGSSYKGRFRQDRRDGYGVLRKADGSVYDGDFKAGAFDGYGILTLADRTLYKGEFKAGQYDGRGVETQADGTRFEGKFQAGLREGPGVLTRADGSVLEGRWARGELHPEHRAQGADDDSAATTPDATPRSTSRAESIDVSLASSATSGSQSSSLDSYRPAQPQDNTFVPIAQERATPTFLTRAIGQLRLVVSKSDPANLRLSRQFKALPARHIKEAELDDRECPMSLDKLKDISQEVVFWKRGSTLAGAHAKEFFRWWNEHRTDPETINTLPAEALFRRKK